MYDFIVKNGFNVKYKKYRLWQKRAGSGKTRCYHLVVERPNGRISVIKKEDNSSALSSALTGRKMKEILKHIVDKNNYQLVLKNGR